MIGWEKLAMIGWEEATLLRWGGGGYSPKVGGRREDTYHTTRCSREVPSPVYMPSLHPPRYTLPPYTPVPRSACWEHSGSERGPWAQESG